MRKTADQMVTEAKAKIENLTPEQVAREQQDGATIVDIREPSEWDETGVIPGAVLAPRGLLEWWADPTSRYHRPEFDPNSRVILHCAAGGRSALAAATLKEMGYGNVAHLEGGITAWKEQGYPTEERADDE